jgi:glycosyltransferase involved in cell wall biosynthesis
VTDLANSGNTTVATSRSPAPSLPLRIGVMLRALAEKGGVGVYTQHLLEELMQQDRVNHYVLYYRTAEHVGRYANLPNVTERVVAAPHQIWWDQIAVPRACWHDRLDVLFHPKFTAPIVAPCPVVMTLHGADWFVPEYARYYPKLNIAYVRITMPLQLRRCAAAVAVSRLTTTDFERELGIPPGKIRTVYFAPGRNFRRVEDPATLRAVAEKYRLPSAFVLTLSGYDRGFRKNINGVVEAYRLFHGRTPHALIVGGKDCWRFRDELGIPSDGYGRDILFPGWIEPEDLPAIYSLASAYLYPSHLEAFPIPLTEAMACGTPIVTSGVNGLKEIAGDVALFVDPTDPTSIADGLERVLTDHSFAEELVTQGRSRSAIFSWDLCVTQTLEVLRAAAATRKGLNLQLT